MRRDWDDVEYYSIRFEMKKTLFAQHYLNVRLCVFAVPTILDLTVGFTPDSAEPTLLNIIQGRRCTAEMYVR